MTISLYGRPHKSPQRVTYREAVMRLRSEGMTERQTASKLGITHTAAQDAARLDRLMAKAGIADPWMQVISVDNVQNPLSGCVTRD